MSTASRVVTRSARLMGGTVGVHIRTTATGAPMAADRTATTARAGRDADRTLRRIGRWADRLTRFSDRSDLAHLNASASPAPEVRPTLGALLAWGRTAAELTDGIVDVTLLEARLRAEAGPSGNRTQAGEADALGRSWSMRTHRRGASIARSPGFRFDLDGVGKGWLADRAVALLDHQPAAAVDADGDIAISLYYGETWRFGIASPVDGAADLATLELSGLAPHGRQSFGLATSGTSIHRWRSPSGDSHHLIDPRTGRPAVTDIVQATVLAASAAEAEAFAKAVVILGSHDSLRLLDRAALGGTVLFTERGEILATPSFTRWLA